MKAHKTLKKWGGGKLNASRFGRALVFGALLTASFFAPAVEAAMLRSTYSGIVPTTNSVLFTGVNLADVRSVKANFGSGAMACDGTATPATAYHFANDGATLTVQFQGYLGDYTKCVKLQLVQDGADISGRAVYTAYVNDRYRYCEGEDADGSGWNRTADGTNYTIRDIVLSDDDDTCLRTDLWWNGADGDTWGGEAMSWLTVDGAATVWLDGARAVFTNGAAQTVAVAAGGVTVSHFTMAGFPVTFTGGTVTLTGSAEVAMRAGAVRFACPLAGSGGFRVANLIYRTDTAGHMQAEPSLIVSNACLAGIESLGGTAYGAWVGVDSTPMRSYFVENDGSTLTAQMQWYGGGYTKCVFIELTQEGAHIYGRVVSAKRWGTEGIDCRGIDFRTQGVNDTPLFQDDGVPIYGLRNLLLGTRVTLAGTNSFTGLLRIENLVTLALDGGVLGDGTFEDKVVFYRGALEVAHTRQTFTGKLTDTGAAYPGSVRVKGAVDPSGSTLTYPHSLPEVETVIFRNADISGWVAAEAQVNPNSMWDKTFPWATTFFFRHDGKRVRCQMQVKDDEAKGFVKCALYEFAQRGADITCRRVGTAYRTGWDSFFGYDFERDSPSGTSYSCSNLVVTVTNASDTAVTLAAANAWYGGTLVDGAVLGVSETNAIPSYAGTSVTVTNRGKMFIDCGYGTPVSGIIGQTTVNLTDGSYLGICRLRALGTATTINVAGGSEINVASGNGNNIQDYGYITHLTLADGSFMSGETFRIGYEGSDNTAYIIATGSAPVRISQPIVVLRGGGTSSEYRSNAWIWEVADITGDGQTDLYLDGELQNYRDGSLNMRPIRKIGEGTVRLGAANSYTGSVTIAEGTILLGADGALNAGIGVTLEGGTLDTGGSESEAGTLSVVVDSTLAVSAEAALAFADSSALNWSCKRLTITGTAGARTLRFGTDGTGLTADQIRKIRWDGNRVKLDANGYLAPHIYGTNLTLR